MLESFDTNTHNPAVCKTLLLKQGHPRTTKFKTSFLGISQSTRCKEIKYLNLSQDIKGNEFLKKYGRSQSNKNKSVDDIGYSRKNCTLWRSEWKAVYDLRNVFDSFSAILRSPIFREGELTDIFSIHENRRKHTKIVPSVCYQTKLKSFKSTWQSRYFHVSNI